MKPSMIVYGVKGGNTRFAERIAEFYGLIWRDESMTIRLTGEIDFFEGGYEEVKDWEEYGFSVKSFEEVAKEINAAIPLTDWESEPPPCIGEWNASSTRAEWALRWWNGCSWSLMYKKYDDQASKNEDASIPTPQIDPIEWRGLSQEPINTEE